MGGAVEGGEESSNAIANGREGGAVRIGGHLDRVGGGGKKGKY